MFSLGLDRLRTKSRGKSVSVLLPGSLSLSDPGGGAPPAICTLVLLMESGSVFYEILFERDLAKGGVGFHWTSFPTVVQTLSY